MHRGIKQQKRNQESDPYGIQKLIMLGYIREHFVGPNYWNNETTFNLICSQLPKIIS